MIQSMVIVMQNLSAQAQQVKDSYGEAFWLNDAVFSYREKPNKDMYNYKVEHYFPSCVVTPFFKFDIEAIGNMDATPFVNTIAQFVQKEMNLNAIPTIDTKRYDNELYAVVNVQRVLLDLSHFKIFWKNAKQHGIAKHKIWPFIEDFSKCPVYFPYKYIRFEDHTIFHACDFYTRMKYYISSPIAGALQNVLHDELPNYKLILVAAREIWQKLLLCKLEDKDMLRITPHYHEEREMQKQFELPTFITIASVASNTHEIEIHNTGVVFKRNLIRFSVTDQLPNIQHYLNTICTLLWSKTNVMKYLTKWNIVDQNTIYQYNISHKIEWKHTKKNYSKEEFATQQVYYCDICPTTQTILCKNAIVDFLAIHELLPA